MCPNIHVQWRNSAACWANCVSLDLHHKHPQMRPLKLSKGCSTQRFQQVLISYNRFFSTWGTFQVQCLLSKLNNTSFGGHRKSIRSLLCLHCGPFSSPSLRGSLALQRYPLVKTMIFYLLEDPGKIHWKNCHPLNKLSLFFIPAILFLLLLSALFFVLIQNTNKWVISP